MADRPILHRPASRLAPILALALTLAACSSACPSAPPPASAAQPLPSAVVAASDPASASPSDAVSDVSPTPAPIDACALIKPAAAAKLAGLKLQDPVPEGDPPTRCVWTAPPTGETAQVEIGVGDGAQKAFDIDKITLQHAFTAVSGIGDEAWAEDDAIFFRKGDAWVSITLVRLNDPAQNAPNLVELARIVVKRF